MVLHRQKLLELLLHWHMSDSQALIKYSREMRFLQSLKAGPERSCSHTDVCEGNQICAHGQTKIKEEKEKEIQIKLKKQK